ncbi:MAG: hypothetical protein MK110_10450 [Fuerstiella sp.]|nr:hypothetical protein [Fuerstiella sp.]
MNAQNAYKLSAVASIVMVLVSTLMVLLWIWGDPWGIASMPEVWGTVATLFGTTILIFAITREMVKVAKSNASSDE